MKNLFYLLTLVFIIPFGCTKKYHGDLDEYQNNCPKPEDYVISDLVSFNGTMATFKNEDDYNRFLIKSLSLTESEQVELLTSINYVTYENHMDSLYLILDSLETREEVLQFISDNNDYLGLIINNENEEEIIEINEPKGIGSQIYNIDNMIQVGLDYFKFVDSFAIINQNIELLRPINSIEDVYRSGLTYQSMFSTVESGEEDINSRACNDLGVSNVLKADRKPRGCKNHRRAKFNWGLRERKISTGDLVQKFVYLDTKTKPYKRGIVHCIWYNYKTEVTRNNFRFSGSVTPPSPLTAENFDVTRPDLKTNTRKIETNIQVFYFLTTKDDRSKLKACFSTERVSITTRGLNGTWLILNQ